MSCENDYCKMTDLTDMGDLCCLTKIFADFRLSMKAENKSIVEAIDRLIGKACDEEHSGSLGALIKVLKQHKRLLCSLNKNCDKDCGCSQKNDCQSHCDDDKKCCLSLCSCNDDDDCCPSCRVTLVDLLDDFKRLCDSRNMVFAFHKDLTFLLETIFNYYSRKACKQPCLPQCNEMFRNIMYLIKLCLGDKQCKQKKNLGVCKVCKPDPNIYPIVIVIFLSLYFGKKLQKYVELYCCCCIGNGQSSCGKSNCDNISISFTKNEFSDLNVCDSQISGTIKCIEIFDNSNTSRGIADITITGSHDCRDDRDTFTGSASGVVRDDKGSICGTIFGSAIGTFSHSECCASGILCGMLVELKLKDPCAVARNPYIDAQPGIISIFKFLDKVNVDKMIEVLGDGVTGIGKRLLGQQKNQTIDCYIPCKDHSKKYRNEKGVCGHDDNLKWPNY